MTGRDGHAEWNSPPYNQPHYPQPQYPPPPYQQYPPQQPPPQYPPQQYQQPYAQPIVIPIEGKGAAKLAGAIVNTCGSRSLGSGW